MEAARAAVAAITLTPPPSSSTSPRRRRTSPPSARCTTSRGGVDPGACPRAAGRRELGVVPVRRGARHRAGADRAHGGRAGLSPCAGPILSLRQPLRDARGDLRQADRAHGGLRAGGLPPGLRRRALLAEPTTSSSRRRPARCIRRGHQGGRSLSVAEQGSRRQRPARDRPRCARRAGRVGRRASWARGLDAGEGPATGSSCAARLAPGPCWHAPERVDHVEIIDVDEGETTRLGLLPATPSA